MESRAYTYIDRGRAVVGNRWVERSWSAFLGVTTGLLQKCDGFEWLTGQSAEFKLETSSAGALGVMDFGEVAWSEENNPDGATLVARRKHPAWEITVRALALHKYPVLIRWVSLMNTGENSHVLNRLMTDSLQLRCEGAQVWTHHFSEAHHAIEWTTDEDALAVALGNHKMIFGQISGGTFQAFAPDKNACSLWVNGPITLGSREFKILATTFLMVCEGDFEGFLRTAYPKILDQHLFRKKSGLSRVGNSDGIMF